MNISVLKLSVCVTANFCIFVFSSMYPILLVKPQISVCIPNYLVGIASPRFGALLLVKAYSANELAALISIACIRFLIVNYCATAAPEAHLFSNI